MKPRSLTLPALAALTALLGLAHLPAQAIGRLADVTIVDRDTGATLPVHYARGEYWVAGRPGARYAITVRNRLGERVLAVPSVDGVNVLSGETAAWDQRGYVFSPYERYQITGWRKSDSQVAAFEFSHIANSYAARTGRPAHVGVIQSSCTTRRAWGRRSAHRLCQWPGPESRQPGTMMMEVVAVTGWHSASQSLKPKRLNFCYLIAKSSKNTRISAVSDPRIFFSRV